MATPNEADIKPDIELPELVVTPDEKPNHMALGLELGGAGFLQQSQRDKHSELDPLDSGSANRIAGHAGMPGADLHAPIWNFDPKTAPQPVEGDPTFHIRQNYADALVNGATHGPHDFAEKWAGTLWEQTRKLAPYTEEHNPEETGKTLAWLTNGAKGLASKLPSNEDLTDTSIGIASAAGILTPPAEGEPPDEHRDAEKVAVVKNNLAQLWATSGAKLTDLYQQALTDPLVREHLTTMPMPQRPRNEILDLSGQPAKQTADQKRHEAEFHDASGQAVHFMGHEGDPLGIGEFAQGIAALPGEMKAYQDKLAKMRADGLEGTDEFYEAQRDNPGLNFLAQQAAFAVIGKGAGKAASAVKTASSDSFGLLWADERGGGPPVGGTPGPVVPETFTEADVQARARPTTNDRDAIAAREEARKEYEKEGKVAADERPIEQRVKDLQAEIADRVTKSPRRVGDRVVDVPPPAAVGEVTKVLDKVDAGLNKLRTNDVADKIELGHLLTDVHKVNEQWTTSAFQEKVAHDIERRLIDPSAPYSPEVAPFMQAVKGLTDHQLELAREIKQKLHEGKEPLDPDGQVMRSLKSVEEGYMHRVVKGHEVPGSTLDPNVDIADPASFKTRGSKLSKYAASVQEGRSTYILEDSMGNRIPGNVPMKDLGLNYGDAYTDAFGTTYHVKQATMREVEENSKAQRLKNGDTSPPVEYQKNFLVNTIENVAHLKRVLRNIDFLSDLTGELESKGMWVKGERDMPPAGRPDLVHMDLPQLKGWVEPRIAAALNEFYNHAPTDLERFMGKASKFLVSALFVTPVPHGMNVSAHWAAGRGWDWFDPSMRGYWRIARYMPEAMYQVLTLGPKYVESLREGNGLPYASVRTENFHTALLNQYFHDQLDKPSAWERYAKSFGLAGVKDLVAAEYRWSRKTLWAWNDVLMMQRRLELEAKGHSLQDAVRLAEKDIPSYKIPTEAFGQGATPGTARATAGWLKGNLGNAIFGRYHYGQVDGLYNMARDILAPLGNPLMRMMGKEAQGSHTLEALGKLTAMGGIGLYVYPLIAAYVQDLYSSVTGAGDNPDNGPRAAGGFGIASLLHNGQRKIYRSITGNDQPNLPGSLYREQEHWANGFSSLMSVTPLWDLFNALRTNKDYFGRDVISPHKDTIGNIAGALELAGSAFYPLGMALKSLHKDGLVSVIGQLTANKLDPPVDPAAKAKIEKFNENMAKARQRKDPVDQTLRGLLDQPALPGPKGRGGGGMKEPGGLKGGGGMREPGGLKR